MSTVADEALTLPPTPQSSKKRKATTEGPEKSKKKRKHDRADSSLVASQETETDKKDKRKKKEKKSDEFQEASREVLEQQDSEIHDPVDGLSNAVPATAAATLEDTPTTNGVHPADTFEAEIEEIDDTLLQSEAPSCFYQKRLSLQLPIPAISLNSSTSSVLAVHLSPLLLTYFAPAEGIVLSFSDPVLSAQPSYGVNLPLKPPQMGEIPRNPPGETFARCADSFGVCWVWLTVTFLVFRPESGDDLKGWTNVSSEGFVGLVSYNYFQTAVGKKRIPKSWIWDGPMRENSNHKKRARKGKLRDEGGFGASQDEVVDSQEVLQSNDIPEGGSGTFVYTDGSKVSATQTFRVVDVEMVPGHEKDRWTLQIDGSLLTGDEEAALITEERQRFEQVQNRRSRSRSKTPGMDAGEMPLMSGAVSFSRAGSPL